MKLDSHPLPQSHVPCRVRDTRPRPTPSTDLYARMVVEALPVDILQPLQPLRHR